MPSLSWDNWDNLIQSRTRTSPEARRPPPLNKLKAMGSIPAFGTAQWQAMMFPGGRGCPYENGAGLWLQLCCSVCTMHVRASLRTDLTLGPLRVLLAYG